MRAKEPKKLALICTFWGQRFRHFFEHYCIPSLLTAGNLPGLAASYDVSILLYTDRPTFEGLKRSPRVEQVSRFAEIRPVYLDGVGQGPASSHWEPWHHAVLSYADEFDGFLLLIPDCVYVKDCFTRVAAALERSDIVYYPVPEVCQELVTRRFDTCFNADGALELDGVAMANVVVDFLHPKHAIGDFAARFFVTHPEFFVATRMDRLALSHVASHSMAVRSDNPHLSYTFNPLADGGRHEFLEILGVGCEPTFKYFDQYLHWPTLSLGYSRTVNLASWAADHREPGNVDYADTEAVIELRDGRASAQHRAARAHPRARAANRLLSYAETAFRLYITTARDCPEVVRQCIALAACLPGLRQRLARIGPRVTLLLPVDNRQFEAVVKAIDRAPRAQDVLARFLLLHVLPGHMRLAEGRCFALLTHPAEGGRMRIFEPRLKRGMTGTVTGRLKSEGKQLTADLLVYYAEMDYAGPKQLVDRLRRDLHPPVQAIDAGRSSDHASAASLAATAVLLGGTRPQP